MLLTYIDNSVRFHQLLGTQLAISLGVVLRADTSSLAGIYGTLDALRDLPLCRASRASHADPCRRLHKHHK